MEISRIRALRGPNLWSRNTAIECVVHCTAQEMDFSLIADFEDKLRARFPAIGGLQALGVDSAISLAHVLEAACLGLQAQAGCPVTFSRTHATPEHGTFQVVVEYSEEAVGKRAMALAEELIAATLSGDAFDAQAAIEELRELDEEERVGPSTGSLLNAAIARSIPYRRLTAGSLVQLGWGAKARKFQAAEVDQTSSVAETIAQDKDLTKRLLHAAGVPVPMGRPAKDAADAWAIAQEVGLPVVVKPQDGNQGKGVTVNITTQEQLATAYATALEFGTVVMVERFLPGHDFRLLVVGNQLVAAARRDPPQVLGDGKRTIRQLVDIVNQDPRRGSGHGTALTKIRLDDIALGRLAAEGLSPESIPAQGQRVVLRNNANLSTGGSATDVTDDVHPDVAARAIEAAACVGLHVCGVDVVCETMLKPLEEQNGGIVEVNAAPGLRMHLAPSFGKPRNVGAPMVDLLFSPTEDGRIPVVAVTGTNGKTTTTRLISHLFATQGLRVGMTNTDGVYVNGRQIDSGDCSGPKSARNVLAHPEVDAAILECARGGILREGLGFDRCQVAVVTNVGEGDHLGMNFINTVEDVMRLKRVIVQNVAPTGYAVLNAIDPYVAPMASVCQGKIIYFGAERHHHVMATHRAQGNRVVYVDGAHIVCAEGAFKEKLALADIPLTRNGTIGFQVDNAMASIGATWAADLPWDIIRLGLASFHNDSANAPGRFNVMNYKGATVVADYGHNPDAIRALVQAVDSMPAKRRSVVISGAGDRRDQDIVEQTRILGASFDDVILYQDACQRGRADGEVLALLRKGLEDASRTSYIAEIHGEFLAIDHALSRLCPEDLCLVLVDQVEESLEHLRQHVANASST